MNRKDAEKKYNDTIKLAADDRRRIIESADADYKIARDKAWEEFCKDCEK